MSDSSPPLLCKFDVLSAVLEPCGLAIAPLINLMLDYDYGRSRLIAIGGTNPHTGQCLSSALLYDPDRNRWVECGALSWPAEAGDGLQLAAGVVLANRYLYVGGGVDNGPNVNKTAYFFDLEAGVLPPRIGSDPPPPHKLYEMAVNARTENSGGSTASSSSALSTDSKAAVTGWIPAAATHIPVYFPCTGQMWVHLNPNDPDAFALARVLLNDARAKTHTTSIRYKTGHTNPERMPRWLKEGVTGFCTARFMSRFILAIGGSDGDGLIGSIDWDEEQPAAEPPSMKYIGAIRVPHIDPNPPPAHSTQIKPLPIEVDYHIPDLPRGRACASAFHFGDDLIVAGGLTIDDGRTKSVIAWSCGGAPKRSQREVRSNWRDFPPLCQARSLGTLLVLDEQLYMVGGAVDDETGALERFDPAAQKWVNLSPTPMARPNACWLAVN